MSVIAEGKATLNSDWWVLPRVKHPIYHLNNNRTSATSLEPYLTFLFCTPLPPLIKKKKNSDTLCTECSFILAHHYLPNYPFLFKLQLRWSLSNRTQSPPSPLEKKSGTLCTEFTFILAYYLPNYPFLFKSQLSWSLSVGRQSPPPLLCCRCCWEKAKTNQPNKKLSQRHNDLTEGCSRRRSRHF